MKKLFILFILISLFLSLAAVSYARTADGSGEPDLPKDSQGRVIPQCGGPPIPNDAVISDVTPPLTSNCVHPIGDTPGQKVVGPTDSNVDQLRNVRATQESQLQNEIQNEKGEASAAPLFHFSNYSYNMTQQTQTVTQAGYALRPRVTGNSGVVAKMRIDLPYLVPDPPTPRVVDIYSEFNQPSNQACPFMDVRHHKANDGSGYYYDYVELLNICTGSGVVLDLADPYITNHYMRNNGAANVVQTQILGTSSNCWNSYIYDYQGQYWLTLMVSCGLSGFSSGGSDWIGFGLDPDYCPNTPLNQVFNVQVLKFGAFSPVTQTDVLHNQSGTCGPAKTFSSVFDSYGMNWTVSN